MSNFSQYNIEEKKYHRVTSVIKVTDPKNSEKRSKNALHRIYSYKKNPPSNQDNLNRGILTHKNIETFLTHGITPKTLDNDFKIVLPYLEFYKDKVVAVEEIVFSKLHKYAGTMDALFKLRQGLVVNDWVTSYRKRTSDQVIHKFLQAAAYALAHQEMSGKKIDLLRVTVIGPHKVQTFDSEPKEWINKWLKRLKKFYRICELYEKERLT